MPHSRPYTDLIQDLIEFNKNIIDISWLSDGRDEDDINLAQLAQHKISSIVQNAVQNVTADALRNAVVAGNSQVAVSSVNSAVQAAAAINSLTAVQSGHQVIQAQMAQHAAQMAQAQAHTQPQHRTDAEILKDNIQNMKQEDPDSDCELVETDIDVSNIYSHID